MSTEPTIRAHERINALIDRGADPIQGTLQRLNATTNAEKVLGIYYAATQRAAQAKSKVVRQEWTHVAAEAQKKYRALA